MTSSNVRIASLATLLVLALSTAAAQLAAQPGPPADAAPVGAEPVIVKPAAAEPTAKPASAEPAPAAPTAVAADATATCATGEACRRKGQCNGHQGACYAAKDANCQQAQICALGNCSAREGRCVIASEADCQRSTDCTVYGRCQFSAGRCVGGVREKGLVDLTVSQTNSPKVARAGRIMTFVGLPSAALGGGLLYLGFSSDGDLGAAAAKLGGTVFTSLGGITAISGIIMWAVGATSVERPAVAAQSLPLLQWHISPASTGVSGSF